METKRRLTLYNERKEEIKEWAKAMYLNEGHAEIFAVGCLYADMNPSPLVIEELIDKACDLLRDLDVFTEDFINYFRKAMKGD